MTAPKKLSDHQRIWAMAWPSIIAGSSTPLVHILDSAVLGHLPDARFLAAVYFAGTVFTFIFWAFGFLRMGTTGLVAQAIGGHSDAFERRQALARVMTRALAISAAIAVVLMLLQGSFLAVAEQLLAPPPEVFAEAKPYYNIRIWSAAAVLFFYTLNGYLIGSEQAKLSLALTIGLNVANGGLNLLFVVGFDMGVTGVALGSLIAEWGAALAGLVILSRQLGLKRLFASVGQRLTWQVDKIKQLFTVNVALFLRTLLLITALAMINREAAQYGDVTMGAAQVLSTYMLLISLGLDGFAYAAEALAGSAYGARDLKRFRAFVVKTSLWAIGAAVLYTLAFGLFQGTITSLITDLPAVRAEIDQAHLPLILLPLIAVACYQLDGIYIGATASWAMTGTMLVAFVPYMLLLPIWAEDSGITGIWWALTVLMALRGVAQLVYYPFIERKIKA